MNTLDTWHKRLRYARLLRGHANRADFAREIGVSPPTAHDWESGDTKEIKGVNLNKVCRKLNINEDWLLYNRGEMDATKSQPDSDARLRQIEMSDKFQRIVALLHHLTDSQVETFITDLETTQRKNMELYEEMRSRQSKLQLLPPPQPPDTPPDTPRVTNQD